MIQRYLSYESEPDSEGEYVLYADYRAAIEKATGGEG